MNYQINPEVESSNSERIIELFEMYGNKPNRELTDFLLTMQENLVISRKNSNGDIYTDQAIADFMFDFRMVIKLITGLSDPRDFSKEIRKVA
jgi:hypothetical protein